jgi:hypothetical protein
VKSKCSSNLPLQSVCFGPEFRVEKLWKQGCKECEAMAFPHFKRHEWVRMIKNVLARGVKPDQVMAGKRRDMKGPHDKKRCEKCIIHGHH